MTFRILIFVLFAFGTTINAAGTVKVDQAASFSFRFTYSSLSPYQHQMVEQFIGSFLPKDSNVQQILNNDDGAIQKIRLAEALLFRNKDNDQENAFEIIRWIYGLAKKDVEPASSDFVGSDLIIIYHKYRPLFPADVTEKVEFLLKNVARITYNKNQNPNYNNMAIMSSFIMEYVGRLYNIEEIQVRGMEKARAIVASYRIYNTLCEYNTPTYYGVDVMGLSLWKELSYSQEMRELGTFLQESLWKEIAMYYNANLRNMCGPFLRGYGMDMTRYNAVIGVPIALAVDDEALAPFPGIVGGHYHDASYIAAFCELGVDLPGEAFREFRKFSAPRFFSRVTPNYYEGDRLKKATAMVNREWMMGCLWGNLKVSSLLKVGTMHWKASNGVVGWLVVPGEGKTNVKVDETTMQIFLATDSAEFIEIFLYAPQLTALKIAGKVWKLDGMELTVNSSLKYLAEQVKDSVGPHSFSDAQTIHYQDLVRVRFQIPKGWDKSKPIINFIPKKNE
jgi:hypothetical protein